ncbi:MAG: hypothetical protein IPJ52_12650 [Rhodocyclaceae bacterium]|nr:hypothetical protein [Rhodocyclaceae bacterium]
MASLASIKAGTETDVLILGFGLAGACAAIEALATESSAQVPICEKMPERHAGGNTRASGIAADHQGSGGAEKDFSAG